MKVGESYCRATVLIGFEPLVASVGGDPLALIDEAGLPREALAKVDMLLSYRKVSLLHELAAKRRDWPTFGLDWGASSAPTFTDIGPVMMMMRFEKNLRTWTESAIKFWTYYTNGMTVRLLDGPDPGLGTLRQTIDAFVPAGRQITERIQVLAHMTAQYGIGLVDTPPVRITFQHSRPASTTRHEEIFCCPVEFDADHNDIVFEARLLDAPLPGDLALFKKLMNIYVRYRIDRLTQFDQSMTTTVALAIPSLLGTGRCNVEAVAQSLGVNVKKLQRLLAAEETTFSEILDNVRDAMARRLLTESSAPVGRIAGLLDYSATAPFTLAFNRWTGMSPVAYRKQMQDSEIGDADEPGA